MIAIGGGITGEVQVNDTSYHLPIKAASRNIEMQLMLDLQQDPKKIPSSSRIQMMELFHNAWEKTCSDIDNGQTFKSNMMTLAFDGSEDHLASKKLMNLVGKEMLIFREQSLKSTAPVTIKELHSKITKPEGVRYNPKKCETPIDERCELFNADDGSLERDEEINSDNNLSDSEATETADINANDDVSAVGSDSNDEV